MAAKSARCPGYEGVEMRPNCCGRERERDAGWLSDRVDDSIGIDAC